MILVPLSKNLPKTQKPLIPKKSMAFTYNLNQFGQKEKEFGQKEK